MRGGHHRTKEDRSASRHARNQAAAALRTIAQAGDVVQLMECIEDMDEELWLTPLHEAVYAGHAGMVAALLERGAVTDLGDDIVGTPLHAAAQLPEDTGEYKGAAIDIAELLISEGGDVNATGHGGRLPLHLAALAGNHGICRILLQAGADPLVSDSSGDTPLHIAAEHGKEAAAATIVAFSRCTSPKNSVSGDTPLHLAVRCNGSAAITEFLVKEGASLSETNIAGLTPLQEALLYDATGVLGCTMKEIARRTNKTRRIVQWRSAFEAHRDANLIFRAARDGRPLELQKRLKLGRKAGGMHRTGAIVVDGMSRFDIEPLEAAQIGGHSECISLLLKAGAAH